MPNPIRHPRKFVQGLVRQLAGGPKDHCFPAARIYLKDPLVRENWGRLFRYADEPGYEEHAEEAEIKKWMKLVEPYTMQTYDGLLSLAHQVRHCERTGVPGVYVETGCWNGGSSALMAMACLHYGKQPREIHACDSFKGLPEPDAAKDTDSWIAERWHIPKARHRGRMVETGVMGAQEKNVIAAFEAVGYSREFLKIHAGWFCDTLPPLAREIGEIAILRLDGDLYASTMDALVNLYTKVVPGGFVVIDDYECAGCRKAITDFFVQQGAPLPFIARADHGVHFFIKP
jgi:hypothetical protein